jgi:hypothetical protein
VNGFQIRFYTEKEIRDLAKGFEILWLGEEYVHPGSLYQYLAEKGEFPI